MRFAIYGAGGLGAYYGARLQAAGQDVGFIARGTNLETMRAHGLRILSPLGDLHLPEVKVTSNPVDLGPVDFIVVAVKTWQVTEVAQAMGPLLGPATIAVPFLNGVDAPYQLAEVLGPDRVLGGLSRIFSMIESPGVIRHFNDSAYVSFGRLDNSASKAAERLRDAFDAAGVDSEVAPDIARALWEKLILVSSWTGISTLARSPMGILRDSVPLKELVDRCIDEGIAVARARGIEIAPDYKATMWAFYAGLPDGATGSMTRDIWSERPSELDAWCGAIHRIGGELGVPTPTHTMCYRLLQPIEAAARNP
ncbi:MAG: 2-dehydropantoate 2-reductase [Pseudomonadota bacterium]